jgi:hypothetical protein
VARTVSLNGVNYSVPEPGDTSYDQSLTNYLVALATAFPQGANTALQALGAELDLGALFGIKLLYAKSQTANPAAAGVLRLSKTDTVSWRNNSNTADVALGISGSDVLQFAGASFLTTPLASELDFGATAGVKSLYYKSRAATIAGAGVLRLAGTASADVIAWRNNANSGDLPLTVNAGDQLLFNGSVVQTGAGVTVPNPLVAPAAASLGLEGNVSDGAAAVGVKIGNANALSNAGARILEIYSDALSTLKAYFDKDANIVHSAGGGTHSTTATNASMTIKGNRNAADAGSDVVVNSTATRTAGNLLEVQNNGTGKFRVDSGGIATASDTAWTAFTYSNSWVDFGSGEVAGGYFKDACGFVHLRGAVKSGTGGTAIATLAAGYRPSATMRFNQNTGTGAGGTISSFSIDSAGVILPLGTANSRLDLDGVVFDTR